MVKRELDVVGYALHSVPLLSQFINAYTVSSFCCPGISFVLMKII